MFYWYGYPYTNFHELNLDWVMRKVSENRNSILALENTVNNLDPEAPIGNPGVLHVGQETGMYNTINEAIAFARQYCTPTRRVLIMIHGGRYDESVRLVPNPGIDMIGLSTTIIACPDAIQYPDGALYTVGSGFFENITFETNGGGAYALHYEVQGYETASESSQCVFSNCKFIGRNGKGGVGCGGGSNDTLKFINCEISSEGGNGGYFHNHPTVNQSNFSLECHSCNIKGASSVAIEFYPSNWLTMTFKDNTLQGKTQFRNMNNPVYIGYVQMIDHLINNSSGNTGRALESEETITASFPSSDFSTFYRVNLPVAGLVNKESVFIEQYADINLPSSITIVPHHEWIEVVYPSSENPGLTMLAATFHIRPQIV